MALVNIGSDPWLTEYESCDKLQREIMEQLSQRKRELKTSEEYSRLSGAIRLRLKQFTSEVDQLKIKLDLESKSSFITSEEIERRSRQVELLHSKDVTMRRIFENGMFDTYNVRDRGQLIGTSSGLQSVQDLGSANWSTDEPNISDLSIESVRIQQNLTVKEQERGLEELSKIISRQKDIANSISNEVDLQNEIIDDLGDHINRTDVRVQNETYQVQIVDRKDRTCGYWIVIIILFIAIVTVFTI